MAAQKAPSASAIAFTPTGTVAASNVQDAIAEVASEAGGGFTPVACLLAREADFNVHDVAGYPVLWDALYDDLWNQEPLMSIPDGLGLTFAFDGSSSRVTAAEAGVWAFSYYAIRQVDASLACRLVLGGIGPNFPWVQQNNAGSPVVDPYIAASLTLSLPAGAHIDHTIETLVVATANPHNVQQVQLTIVRLA